MLNTSKVCAILCSKCHLNRRQVVNVSSLVLFPYLVLYSIFVTIYLDNDLAPLFKQPYKYDIEDVSVTPINCTFSISSQYQRTPRFVCYFLLVFTVVIRNYECLAAGAAAWVMTYSGVAAIHFIILFATENLLNQPKAESHCERFPIPRTSDLFFACTGVSDPDASAIGDIISNVMLGALPMAALSTTFRKSTGKVLLMLWLVLLAVGHTFDNLISANRNFHFQVCQKNHVESLPGFDFQATLLDQSWYDSFSLLVSTTSRETRSNGAASSPDCFYSCFATTAYVGRKKQDIGVLSDSLSPGPFVNAQAEERVGGIAFWWSYTFFAFLTFFIMEKRVLLPKWVH